MQLTIIRDDSVMGIDGDFRTLDLSSLDPSISAIQWNGTVGHVEYYTDPNKTIDNIEELTDLIQTWNDLTPPPPLPETLEEAKSLQKSLINSARDTEESGGFEYLGKILDSDERSALRITTASMSAQLSIDLGQPFSIDWTCKDNSILVLDGQQTIEMPKALAIHGLTMHGKAKYLKDLIDSATTIEEVKAITW